MAKLPWAFSRQTFARQTDSSSIDTAKTSTEKIKRDATLVVRKARDVRQTARVACATSTKSAKFGIDPIAAAHCPEIRLARLLQVTTYLKIRHSQRGLP